MLCNARNCSTSAAKHEFDADSCKLVLQGANLIGFTKRPDDLGFLSEELSSYEWPENGVSPSSSSLSADSDFESHKGRCENGENMKTKIAKAQRFFLQWKPIEKREKLKQDPQYLISSLELNFQASELQKRFTTAAVTFIHFDKDFLYNILCAFLDRQNPDNLYYFDIYIGGCLMAYQRSQSLIKKITDEKHAGNNTTGTIKKSLKDVAVSPSLTKPAETPTKGLDMKKPEVATKSLKESKPVSNDTTVKYKGFICTPLSLILNDQGTLDGMKTIRFNDGLTMSDVTILQALEYSCSTSLSLLTQMTWRELKSLNSKPVHSTPRERERAIWKNYLFAYNRYKVRSPELIKAVDVSSTKSSSVEVKGFKCFPVFLVVDEDGLLDGVQTMRVNANITLADAPLLYALEYANAKPLSKISQMPWEELKRLRLAEGIGLLHFFDIFKCIFKSSDYKPRCPELTTLSIAPVKIVRP